MNTISSLLKNLRNRTPVGSMQMYGGSTPPTDWLLCDGSAVSRESYSALFGVIGTAYGAGNGTTTFNLPDMRGRMPIGTGEGDATGHTSRSLASKGGNEDAIVPYHDHTASGGAVQDKPAFNTNNSGTCTINSSGGHSHSLNTHDYTGSSSAYVYELTYYAEPYKVHSVMGSGAHTHTVPNHTHSIPAHNHAFTPPTIEHAGSSGNTTGANMTPYLTVNFIIYAGTTA